MVLEILLRCVLSGFFAGVLYLLSGYFWSRKYSREVGRNVIKHDVKLGFISLLFGSPVLQLFAFAAEKYHFTKLYTKVSDHGWAWWVLSIPLYLLLWDLVFYLGHLVLHMPFVYRKSHFRHHACRPPVPWSGIAIDPPETMLSGILPYTVPLFFFPFHIWTVYALNIMLMFWATMVHSAYPWSGSPLFMTPKDHNLHHAFGLKNRNFAAVFTIWDRIFGTLDRERVPPWWGKAHWTPKGRAPTKATSEADLALAEIHGMTDENDQRDLRKDV